MIAVKRGALALFERIALGAASVPASINARVHGHPAARALDWVARVLRRRPRLARTGDWLGMQMFFSSYGAETNRRLLGAGSFRGADSDHPGMQRVAVVGSSGAGKSWLASRLAVALRVSYVEFDALHHGPGWSPLAAEEMRARLDVCCPAEGAWVADGNFPDKGGDIVRARADAVVWLDFPRGTVMRQVVARTSRRLLLREQLWNGNRESLREVLARDPERSIVWWAWTSYEAVRAAYAAQSDERWIRLTSRAEVRRFLAAARRSG